MTKRETLKMAKCTMLRNLRFRNTLADLKDCYDVMHGTDVDDLSKNERRAFVSLIRLCRSFVTDFSAPATEQEVVPLALLDGVVDELSQKGLGTWDVAAVEAVMRRATRARPALKTSVKRGRHRS